MKASFLRALEPGSRAGRQWPLFPIKGAREYAAGEAKQVDGIAVPDDSTVGFTLARPFNLFPKFMAMPVAAVVPTPTPADFDQHPIGSGPWRFVSWSHDDQILLARNDRYWSTPAKEDSLRLRIIPEVLTQAAEFESGTLSVVEIPFSETLRWEQGLRPAQRRSGASGLNYGVDVQTGLKTAMASRGVRAAGAIPPGILGYDPTRKPYPWDTAQARRLLVAAGYGNGFPLQLWRSKRAELARVALSHG